MVTEVSREPEEHDLSRNCLVKSDLFTTKEKPTPNGQPGRTLNPQGGVLSEERCAQRRAVCSVKTKRKQDGAHMNVPHKHFSPNLREPLHLPTTGFVAHGTSDLTHQKLEERTLRIFLPPKSLLYSCPSLGPRAIAPTFP